jgi:hypothetical protein
MGHALPRPVGDLILDAIPQLGERLLEARVGAAWPALVGADVARRARPGRVVRGVLEVTVDNSPWLSELTLRGPDLTRTVHARFPDIAALRFVLGPLPAADAPFTGAPSRRPAPVSEADARDIAAAVAAIPDPTLAGAVRRVMTRAHGFAAVAPGRRPPENTPGRGE